VTSRAELGGFRRSLLRLSCSRRSEVTVFLLARIVRSMGHRNRREGKLVEVIVAAIIPTPKLVEYQRDQHEGPDEAPGQHRLQASADAERQKCERDSEEGDSKQHEVRVRQHRSLARR
jgi:hypothetical protein